jgi:two-component system NtrC family response regulator
LKDRAGAFEIVGGGYVFLDEVGDMPLNHQAKLLRVIQERKVTRVGSNSERPVTFRTISATNVNLKTAIADGKFREDLYYRLAKVVIRIPSLKERASDIPELVNFFLAQRPSERPVTVTSQAMDLLCSYDWPGNVRQLESAIEVMAIKCTGGVIRDRDVCKVIPEIGAIFFRPVRSFLGQKGASLVSQEKKKYEGALLQARGDREAAARILQVSRATFFRRAKELGIISGRKH